MKKRIISLIFCVIILSITVFSVSAQDEYPVLIDGAELLTETERVELTDKLTSVASEIEYKLIIITIDSLDGYDAELTAQSYANDYYGFENSDGALLLVSMNPRKMAVYSNKIDREAVCDKVQPYLSNGNYSGAFVEFIDECKSGLSFHFGKNMLISIAIGLIIAFIVTKSMKSQLHTVDKKADAADYVKDNSMNLTSTRDTFLYFTVTKTPRPKSNKSGSGGSSHGSSSRSF